ncbi:hypothetical protein Zm00014a_031121 [Zea mays]|uniref:Uncharacterized protein n=1 Tax=Zea mays TaxID=4577 RepID=A0A3L6D6Q1_MAIZE|nr:hypothetical protein Zm00014a_031121 [Zea mays]
MPCERRLTCIFESVPSRASEHSIPHGGTGSNVYSHDTLLCACSMNSRTSYSGWLLIPRRTVHALSNVGEPSSFSQKLVWQRTSI